MLNSDYNSSLSSGKSSSSKTSRCLFLLDNWAKDILLLIAFVVLLGLFRISLILLFWNQFTDSASLNSFLLAIWFGLKLDVSTATKWLMLPMLLAVMQVFVATKSNAWLSRVRMLFAYVFCFVVILLFIIDAGYFYIYGDHFNQLIFGVIFDDVNSVLITIWKEYHPLLLFTVSVIISVLCYQGLKKWINLAAKLQDILRRYVSAGLPAAAVVVIIVIGLLYMGRGMQFSGPPLGVRHANITEDILLNRMIPNPLLALWHTIKNRIEMESSDALKYYWPSGNMHQAISIALAGQQYLAGQKNTVNKISTALKKTVSTVGQKKPKHIFIVLMESQSGWTLFPEYRKYGFSPELSALADRGYYIQSFLPASNGTIGAINNLVTGLPDSGLYVNYEKTLQRPLKTSIAYIFENLGYKTRFFYGGPLTWQRLGEFASEQGFEEIYGGKDTGAESNEWGVDDKYLFQFIENKVLEGGNSLNFIMTTTSHPPYDIDLKAEGYDRAELPDGIKSAFTESSTMQVLGHLWYADKQLGQFVKHMEAKSEGLLFAITGDHIARLRLNFSGNSRLEQVAVPLVIYGDVLDSEKLKLSWTAASHIDLVPTLVETVAPQGFVYHSYGNNLYNNAADYYGMSFDYIVTKSSLVAIDNPGHQYMINGANNSSLTRTRINTLILRNKALKALSWYRVKRGDTLQTVDLPVTTH